MVSVHIKNCSPVHAMRHAGHVQQVLWSEAINPLSLDESLVPPLSLLPAGQLLMGPAWLLVGGCVHVDNCIV